MTCCSLAHWKGREGFLPKETPLERNAAREMMSMLRGSGEPLSSCLCPWGAEEGAAEGPCHLTWVGKASACETIGRPTMRKARGAVEETSRPQTCIEEAPPRTTALTPKLGQSDAAAVESRTLERLRLGTASADAATFGPEHCWGWVRMSCGPQPPAARRGYGRAPVCWPGSGQSSRLLPPTPVSE